MAILQVLKHQFLDSSGNPLSGGKVYTYAAGTSTPKDTYTDQGGLTANANPVILDSRGEASIWFNGSYKVVLKTAADATIWTVDNIQDPATGFVTLTGIETLTNKTLTSPSISSPTITGSGIVTGTLTPSGAGTITATTATNLSGGRFSVHKNNTNQTGVVSATPTLITWSTESFDTASNFASNKFTPSTAGKYFLIASLASQGGADLAVFSPRIYKNGALAAMSSFNYPGNISPTIQVSALVEANGTTDYFEIYVYHTVGSNLTIGGIPETTYFSGYYIGS